MQAPTPSPHPNFGQSGQETPKSPLRAFFRKRRPAPIQTNNNRHDNPIFVLGPVIYGDSNGATDGGNDSMPLEREIGLEEGQVQMESFEDKFTNTPDVLKTPTMPKIPTQSLRRSISLLPHPGATKTKSSWARLTGHHGFTSPPISNSMESSAGATAMTSVSSFAAYDGVTASSRSNGPYRLRDVTDIGDHEHRTSLYSHDSHSAATVVSASEHERRVLLEIAISELLNHGNRPLVSLGGVDGTVDGTSGVYKAGCTAVVKKDKVEFVVPLPSFARPRRNGSRLFDDLPCRPTNNNWHEGQGSELNFLRDYRHRHGDEAKGSTEIKESINPPVKPTTTLPQYHLRQEKSCYQNAPGSPAKHNSSQVSFGSWNGVLGSSTSNLDQPQGDSKVHHEEENKWKEMLMGNESDQHGNNSFNQAPASDTSSPGPYHSDSVSVATCSSYVRQRNKELPPQGQSDADQTVSIFRDSSRPQNVAVLDTDLSPPRSAQSQYDQPLVQSQPQPLPNLEYRVEEQRPSPIQIPPHATPSPPINASFSYTRRVDLPSLRELAQVAGLGPELPMHTPENMYNGCGGRSGSVESHVLFSPNDIEAHQNDVATCNSDDDDLNDNSPKQGLTHRRFQSIKKKLSLTVGKFLPHGSSSPTTASSLQTRALV
ncbi:hypothetical protein BGZ58_007549 [Dissophora ornata]|nr:hypothetical protein BGZ58_007549 [Dissophora ornata]